MRAAWTVLIACTALWACTEKPQTAGKRKPDVSPSQGTPGADAAYTAEGWKVGDATSWEAQLKARTISGQTESARTSAP